MKLPPYGTLTPGTVIGTTSVLSPLGAVIRCTTAGMCNAFNPGIASHVLMVVNVHDLLYGVEMSWPKIRMVGLNDIGRIAFCESVIPDYNYDLQHRCNKWLLKSHEIGVKYDLKELLKFWKIKAFDDPRKLVCSGLYREMCRGCGIPYPNRWNDRVSPYDVQRHLGAHK